MDDNELLKKRCRELALRAEKRGQPCCTEFLTLAEQEVARRCGASALAGGYDGAERRVAVFGGGEEDAPIAVLRVAPRAPRFAEKLTHRDLLGALMALGLRRSLFGDLLEGRDGVWHLFCLREQAPYVIENWTEARHTQLSVAESDERPAEAAPPEPTAVVIASERLDALIAAVWKLSRAESQRLFAEGLVFVNGQAVAGVSREPKPGDAVTVRGTGRFSYEGVERETKKGRLRALVRIWR